jgi:hypothetical protein
MMSSKQHIGKCFANKIYREMEYRYKSILSIWTIPIIYPSNTCIIIHSPNQSIHLDLLIVRSIYHLFFYLPINLSRCSLWPHFSQTSPRHCLHKPPAFEFLCLSLYHSISAKTLPIHFSKHPYFWYLITFWWKFFAWPNFS